MLRSTIALLILACVPGASFAQKNFGFDNRKPSGQDYIPAEESVKRFQLLPGWEAKVFAAEPDVINPIAFTVDERGRLWVVECFEYPKRTPKGKKPRDRIKILEDTDGDGKADKVTIWAEGKDLPIGWDLASGIEVGHGGVFLGAPPYLFFLSDPNNTGKCTKQEILLQGFGSQDTHETLNTFQWGPDGKLYGLHGIFTQSTVNEPEAQGPGNQPDASARGVKMNAAVWRYDPSPLAPLPKGERGGKGKFDIFAEGTSNPWGMDFDKHGQCFLACCVIPHLFHMVPGGTYKRQAGASFNPYSFGLLNEICDHIHHKESGWAHAGLLVLEGEHIPKNLKGSLIMGSIHGCSIKRDELRPNGSTFIGTHAPDFLVSGDKNFRPINLRWGQNGEIYCIDWHDQNPCHQAPPDSWDQKHGRIYRFAPKGAKSKPPVDLSKMADEDLMQNLKKDDPYWYRTALRLIAEEAGGKTRKSLNSEAILRALLKTGAPTEALRGLWGLHAIGKLNDSDVEFALKHSDVWLRSWSIRLLGERNVVDGMQLASLNIMATKDPSPIVRSQLASTAQRLTKQDVLPLLHNLMKQKEDRKDPNIPLLIWLAYEPRVVSAQRGDALDWLKDNAAGNPLVAEEIVPRTMRRLVATGKLDDLEACLAFVGALKDDTVRGLALDGLATALKGRQVEAPPSWKRVSLELAKSSDAKVRDLARKLAVNFQDAAAIARALKIAADSSQGSAQRLDAIRDIGLSHPVEGFKLLLSVLLGEEKTELRIEATRALANYDNPELAASLLGSWKKLPREVRQEALNVLAGRKAWAKELLAALGKKTVERTEVTNNVVLRMLAFNDKSLNAQIEETWGKFRDSPKELAQLIDKMRLALHDAPASFERGKLVFDKHCAKCHRFDGKGHDVGPNLEGAARDIEYLLVNILDPNRVIGQPYYMRTVELKSGRIETGLLHAEDEQTITLKQENDVLKVIPKKDIEGKVIVQSKSVMPEGLANNMSVQDLRDLIRYMMAHPFLTDVKIAGPFPSGSATGIDPANLDYSKSKWTSIAVGVPGRIPLPSLKTLGQKGRVYVVAEVTAPASMRTRLQLGGAHTVKVWLNGAVVYEDRPGKIAEPDQAGVDVELRAGKNVLCFEIVYTGDNEVLYARLLDPNRQLGVSKN